MLGVKDDIGCIIVWGVLGYFEKSRWRTIFAWRKVPLVNRLAEGGISDSPPQKL